MKMRGPWGAMGGQENVLAKGSEESGGREFLLMMKGFSTDDAILNNPNVFIADTGATSDTTQYNIEF